MESILIQLGCSKIILFSCIFSYTTGQLPKAATSNLWASFWNVWRQYGGYYGAAPYREGLSTRQGGSTIWMTWMMRSVWTCP
ncbi:hypothetical protein HanPI659440_Chr11g0423931 [Helianthus annuus]|nr:hypothetical protein HanPI659440_Chr11g0423931 [Helianthus annuus]